MDFNEYTSNTNRQAASSTALARLMAPAVGKGILGLCAFSACILEYTYAREAMVRLLRDENGQLAEGELAMATITAIVFVIVSIGWFHVGLKRTVEKGTPLRLVPWILMAIIVVTFAQAALVALMDMPRGGTGPGETGNGFLSWMLNGSALIRCLFIVMAGLTAAYGFNLVLKAVHGAWQARSRGSDGQNLTQNSHDLQDLATTKRPILEDLKKDNYDFYVDALRHEATAHAKAIDLILASDARVDAMSIIETEILKSAPFYPEIPADIRLVAKRVLDSHKIDLELLPQTVAEFTPRMRSALANHANWLRSQIRRDVIEAAL